MHLSGSLVAQTPPASSLTHLRVLLGHVLLGELGKLHQLGDDLLDIVAVGAVHQGGCHGVQDGLVRGLESRGRGTRRSKAERKLENKSLLPRQLAGLAGATQLGEERVAEEGGGTGSTWAGWAEPATGPLRAWVGAP